MHGLNLARKPFLNRRPLYRLAMSLWVLGVALLVLNVWLFGSYLNESGDIRTKLADLDTAIENEEAQFTKLEERFQRLDLTEQNLKSVFLNWLIANRTFPWSDLFDDLEDVLPMDVRLLNLRPEIMSEEVVDKVMSAARSATSRRSSRSSSSRSDSRRTAMASKLATLSTRPEEVVLQFEGIAKTDEALMEFVDALYGSPIFKNPGLDNDRIDRTSGDISFSLGVSYSLWHSDSGSADSGSADSSASLAGDSGVAVPAENTASAEASDLTQEDAEDQQAISASVGREAGGLAVSEETRDENEAADALQPVDSENNAAPSAEETRRGRDSSVRQRSQSPPTRLGGAMTPNRAAPPPPRDSSQASPRTLPTRGARPGTTTLVGGTPARPNGGLREVPPSPEQNDGPPPEEVRPPDRDRRPPTSMPPSASGSPRLRRNGR